MQTSFEVFGSSMDLWGCAALSFFLFFFFLLSVTIHLNHTVAGFPSYPWSLSCCSQHCPYSQSGPSQRNSCGFVLTLSGSCRFLCGPVYNFLGAMSSQDWLICCWGGGVALCLVMSASPYRLLTHFGSVVQKFGCWIRLFSSLNSFGFTMVQRGESGVDFLAR